MSGRLRAGVWARWSRRIGPLTLSLGRGRTRTVRRRR